jgi:two-component system, LytTR family, sensor kinase
MKSPRLPPPARQVLLFNAAFWLAVTAFHNGEAAIGGMRVDAAALIARCGAGTLGFLLSSILAAVVFRTSGEELRLRLRSALGAAALLAIVFSAVDYVIWYVILAEKLALSAPVMLILGWSYRLSLLLACFGLYFTIHYSAELRDRESRLLEARAQAHEAQLRALRYQVNPHLLFNALNALSALVVTGQARPAGEFIDKLARFYRAALAPDSALKVTLAQEIELQARYLDIERTRFPGRVRMSSDVGAGLDQALVPHLLLQPLVENAVRHGVANTFEPVEIRLSARRDAGALVLNVDNNAPRSAAEAPPGRAGIGLANVRDRLRACYGESGSLAVSAPPEGGFRVEMRLPLELTL